MNETNKDKLFVSETIEAASLHETCQCQRPADPCAIIILGASGDLTFRKLIPALYRLYKHDYMPGSFVVVGAARTDFTSSDFKDSLKNNLAELDDMDMSQWQAFEQHLFYQPIAYNSLESFRALSDTVTSLDARHGLAGNRMFYLALPPFLYETAVSNMGNAGMASETSEEKIWSRIIVEKPFGTNLETSVVLNNLLQGKFKEHQIYRIDHYLAKETVQNILFFRFANAIFEPIWNRQYIDYIDICAAETIGVEHRAGYYEKAGVIRDMFQNHILQLLALIGMEPPALFAPEMVRDEKAKFLRCLRPFERGEMHKNIVLGQYTKGHMGGKDVPAYREENGVDPHSLVPTYARMRVFADNWRWHGVPFYLMSGKRLAEKATRIHIQFRSVPHSIFGNVIREPIAPNRLTFMIQPNEKISLTFQAKNPGATICPRAINMDFNYEADRGQVLEAYEKVLIDCMNGDQMLFLRQDSEELCWMFLTPLIEDCERCLKKGELLRLYAAGAWGPTDTPCDWPVCVT